MVSKVKDVAQAAALIKEWTARENKPATAQSLTDALGSRITKAVVQKVLDDLVADKTLCLKNLKKVNFYYNNPALCTAADSTVIAASTEESEEKEEEEEEKEEIVEETTKDTRRETLLAEYATLKAQTQAAALELSRLQRTATLTELHASCEALEATVAALRVRRATLAQCATGQTNHNTTTTSTSTTLESLIPVYRVARALWKARKETTQRALDAVLGEGGPAKSCADVFNIVDDDAAAVSWAGSAVTLPARFCPRC